MKRFLGLATSLVVLSIFPARAISTRTIYVQDIDSVSISLKVFKGYGLTINFMPTGETIKQVWLGDPTRYSFTSNGNLCAKNQSDCEGSPATVIFLRQIKPITFPNMTSSADGSTQITIITDQRQYQFKLIAASGQPEYTSLAIKPETEKPLPLAVSSNADITLTRTAKPVGKTLQRNDANALAYGLVLARQQGQIKPNSSTWRKVQDAIRLLRQGKDRQTVIARSGISAQLFNQLIQLGKL